MIAMQYKIKLPNDFDMNVVRQRVKDNGHKTDGFCDLLFKAYLISENTKEQLNNNEYAPLYLWKQNNGMNKFIFEGFYDNILSSFGWQQINIAVPLYFELNENFSKSKWLLEIEKNIKPTNKMEKIDFSITSDDILGKVLVYNPHKWQYTEFYFFKDKPIKNYNGKYYEILHISE